jgi:ribosomal protein S18 acetylase RimI-like enzyme
MPTLPHVRRATVDDLEELGEMGAALAKMHHDLDPRRFMYGPGFVEGYRSWFGEELQRKKVYLGVVPRDGHGEPASKVRLAGYVYGRLEGRDWANLLDAHAALVDVYVRPEERKHGAGEALVRAFSAWAEEKKAPRVVLSTATQNDAAQHLFRRCGFRSTMIEMTRESG